VEREWLRSSLLRAEVDLHSFVVVPNHLHGLLTITPGSQDAANELSVDDGVKGARHARLRQAPRSLGSLVAGYKAATFREINALKGSTVSIWQCGYHEHAVRDERDFERIAEYIANNPFNWSTDRENIDRPGNASQS